MTETKVATTNKSVVFKGKKPRKEHVRRAAKLGLISPKQIKKLEGGDQ